MSLDSLNRSGVQTSNPALYDTLKELLAFKDKIDNPFSSAGLIYEPADLGPLGSFPQSQGSDIIWKNQFDFIIDASTGVVNNYNPNNAQGNTCYLMTNPADVTIGGFGVGYPGQMLLFKAQGNGVVYFKDRLAAAAANTKILTNITSGPTPIFIGGYALFIYVVNSFVSGENYWMLITHSQGTPITPIFSAANYAGSGFTWTVGSGNITSNNFIIHGRELYFSTVIDSSAVGAAPGNLLIVGNGAWGGYTAFHNCGNPMFHNDAGSYAAGLTEVNLGISSVQILYVKAALAPWTAGSLTIFSQIRFGIQ